MSYLQPTLSAVKLRAQITRQLFSASSSLDKKGALDCLGNPILKELHVTEAHKYLTNYFRPAPNWLIRLREKFLVSHAEMQN